jgi:hypothetical protein
MKVASLKVHISGSPKLTDIEKHNEGLKPDDPDYVDPVLGYHDIMGVGRFPNGKTTKLTDIQLAGFVQHVDEEGYLNFVDGVELKLGDDERVAAVGQPQTATEPPPMRDEEAAAKVEEEQSQ